jgi:hypothetical protein
VWCVRWPLHGWLEWCVWPGMSPVQHKGSAPGIAASSGSFATLAGGNKTISALLQLNCPRRVLLTGTPVQVSRRGGPGVSLRPLSAIGSVAQLPTLPIQPETSSSTCCGPISKPTPPTRLR